MKTVFWLGVSVPLWLILSGCGTPGASLEPKVLGLKSGHANTLGNLESEVGGLKSGELKTQDSRLKTVEPLPALPQLNSRAESVAAALPPRVKTNGVVYVQLDPGDPPETVIRNESTGIEYPIGTNRTATIGGIAVGSNTFVAYNVAEAIPGEPQKYFSNPVTVMVGSDTNALVYYGQMFRWPGPPGTLQRSTNLIHWQDVRPIVTGAVILQTNDLAREFLRVKL